jgi:hypothetical protein
MPLVINTKSDQQPQVDLLIVEFIISYTLLLQSKLAISFLQIFIDLNKCLDSCIYVMAQKMPLKPSSTNTYQVWSVGPTRMKPRKVITAVRFTSSFSDLSTTNCQGTLVNYSLHICTNAMISSTPIVINNVNYHPNITQ